MKYLFLIITVCSILLTGCANRYPNWEYVRIEQKIPSSDCEYKVQESCYGAGAKCFNYYKKRATTYGANTVVLIQLDKGQKIKGGAFTHNKSGGSNITSNPVLTALADYYHCPK